MFHKCLSKIDKIIFQKQYNENQSNQFYCCIYDQQVDSVSGRERYYCALYGYKDAHGI